MPIDDLAVRFRELGRLKFGEDLGDRPTTLEVWRLTSPHFWLLEAASKVYGGNVGAGELITDTSELPVVLPPQDLSLGQWFELWTAGGLQRRCSGSALVESDERSATGWREVGPCQCTAAKRECKPTTVLRVLLPELPDLGVWRLTTRSFYAAAELPGAVEMLQAMAGTELPRAVLGLERRTSKKPGQPPKHFTVPILKTRETLSALAGGYSAPLSLASTAIPALEPPATMSQEPQNGPQELPNPSGRSQNPEPGPSEPPAVAWDELEAFLAGHPPGAFRQASGPDMVAALVELEALMLRARLWHPATGGRGPLDVVAPKALGLAVGVSPDVWRTEDLGADRLRQFAARALLASHSAFDKTAAGRAARARELAPK